MQESLKEYNRRMMREWRARKRQDPEWLAEHRKKECARVRAYYATHPEKRREHWLKFRAKSGVERRAKELIRHAKKVIARGVMYTPRFWMRKPEWMPVGRVVMDVNSQWLASNLTPAQRAYARELAIERRAK
jgi:hypothetical protein